MPSFDREEIKRILTKTMEDVKKFQKNSQLDKKKFSELNEKINLLVKEKKTLNKLRFGTENDEEAREVARRELQLEEVGRGREYERQIKRSKKRQYCQYTQENLESETSEEEEVKYKKSKRKRKIKHRKTKREASGSSSENNSSCSSGGEEEEEEQKKRKIKKKVSQHIKKNQSNLR